MSINKNSFKEDIIKAHLFLRKENNDIPDEVLDFMKRVSLEAVDGFGQCKNCGIQIYLICKACLYQ